MEFVADRLKGEVAPSTSPTSRARWWWPRTSASPRATRARAGAVGHHAHQRARGLPGSAAWWRRNIVDADTGEIIAKANDELTEALLKKLREAGMQELQCISPTSWTGPTSPDLRADETADEFAARVAIYRMMRPGEPPTEDAVQALFSACSTTRHLRPVARGPHEVQRRSAARRRPMVLTNDDILAVVKILVDLRNGRGEVDDIDHLGNRRVRCVGELAENQYRTGLARIEKAVKGVWARPSKPLMPHDLINSKPISAGAEGVLRCLAAVAVHGPDQPAGRDHAQAPRLGVGPGRPDRERAGFEVRDVHVTHYGRVCPIETPEGPNIGLINSLALYARLNEYGFIETPYRRVVDGKVTTRSITCRPSRKASTSSRRPTPRNSTGRPPDGTIWCRRAAVNRCWSRRPHPVHGRVAGADRVGGASLDALPGARRRQPALMGANMSRQAVPVLRPEKAAGRHRHRARGRGRFRAPW